MRFKNELGLAEESVSFAPGARSRSMAGLKRNAARRLFTGPLGTLLASVSEGSPWKVAAAGAEADGREEAAFDPVPWNPTA